MHVRLRQKGDIDPGAQVREAHPPSADVVVISAHDSELGLWAHAHQALDQGLAGNSVLTLTACNYLPLQHPQSVALLIKTTLARTRIVVLRMIGGAGYWPVGVEALRQWAHAAAGRELICLPGGSTWDETFANNGTAASVDAHALWRYVAEGGAENYGAALQWLGARIRQTAPPPPPRAMPSAGFLEPKDARPADTNAADAMIVIYRSLAQAGDTEPVDAIKAALAERGLSASAVYVASLKDVAARTFIESAITILHPSVIINATAFAADTHQLFGDIPVLQTVFAGMARRDWAQSMRGMGPADLAMHVVMPEIDGRIFAGPVAFKIEPAAAGDAHHAPAILQAEPREIAALAERVSALIRLQRKSRADRRIVLMLANYPNRDGRLANGVGLDTPASVALAVQSLAQAGYDIADMPCSSADLMRLLTGGVTNATAKRPQERLITWSLKDYRSALTALPYDLQQAVRERWCEAEHDPHVVDGMFHLALHRFGNTLVGIQPSRGYDIDPVTTFHDPDLVPPHRYIATYLWLRQVFDADAVIHFGKHGNLEWLPGKAAGLSRSCWPAALIGPLPNIYPFIVNDPGEGVQAKRRTAAVIIDHLTPPLARAELHGDLARLEALVDEYALAADLDPRRAHALAGEIAGFAGVLRLDDDLALGESLPLEERVRRVDAHLCDLKEMQIRDGLHVFGQSPEQHHCVDLAVSIARIPRFGDAPHSQSLHRAIAADLGLGDFDPLTRHWTTPYAGPMPDALSDMARTPWRTTGDTVERIEDLAVSLVNGATTCPPEWTRTCAVLSWLQDELMPSLQACAEAETSALLRSLDGRAVCPGPSGAPSRGRPDVLPTGRNFYAVDPRAVPTQAAWRIGQASAEALIAKHYASTGEWLRTVAFSAWGTANMRTGGDDVAQALALLGCQPVWEATSGRVTGFEVLSSSDLKRPRVDVTFRVSGLFRDAFPTQLDLIDSAVRLVAALDEDEGQNPIAAAARRDKRALKQQGYDAEAAWRQATSRVFGSKPGAYGAGLQALIDEGGWADRTDFAGAYLAWGGYAYGGGQEGKADEAGLSRRLKAVEAVIQSQDNREHDLLDSDDYYQFMGGLSATVETLSGKAPVVYHTDTSRPETPLVRTLDEEIARVVRGRAGNPKWIAGVMRHGYKGAFEMAATVDYLFAFAATTNAVKSYHFDQLFEAYLGDESVQVFIAGVNPDALREMAERFAEAMRRGLWTPRANTAADLVHRLCHTAEGVIS